VRNREIRPLPIECSYTPFAFSPDGGRMAVTLGADTVEIRDLRTGKEAVPLPRHSYWIDAVAFSAQGAPIAVTSGGAVHLWDRATQAALGRITAGRLVTLSPDGVKLAGVTAKDQRDETVGVWDWRASRLLVELEGLDPTVLLFPTDNTLLVGNALGQIGLYDLDTRKWLKALREPGGAVIALAISACRGFLASESEDRLLHIWQLGDGKALKAIPLPAFEHNPSVPSASQLAFSADGKQLAWGTTAGFFQAWDSQGRVVGKLKLQAPVQSCAVGFTPKGRCVAAGSTAIIDDAKEFQLRVWDVATGKSLFATRPQPQPLHPVTFAPDRRHLVSGSWDRTVLFWDISEW
jgi:WD40 repeat protein